MKNALTLVEIMLAAVILVLICVMSFLLFANCIILNEFNRERTVAASHAQYVMEDIKDADFDTVRDDGNTTWDWLEANLTANGLTALRNESVDTEVNGTDLLSVSVTVSWEDRKGRGLNLGFETLIAEQ